jgi:hypothetical protein
MSLGLHLSPENTSMSIGVVHPKFNVKSKSSLKSILLDYGLPDDEVQRLHQQESETTKKKVCSSRFIISLLIFDGLFFSSYIGLKYLT